jgi:hypothetical protein
MASASAAVRHAPSVFFSDRIRTLTNPPLIIVSSTPGGISMRNVFALAASSLLFSSGALCAQVVEVGGNVGLGRMVTDSPLPAEHTIVSSAGMELSVGNHDNRGAFFADYNHSARLLPAASDTIGTLNFVAVGARLHSAALPGDARAFIDIGFGFGRFQWCERGRKTTTIAGYAAGTGVIIPIGDRWYVRPQVRGYLLAIAGSGDPDFSDLRVPWSLRVGVGTAF